MSADGDDAQTEAVGYRRPPKSGQFRKSQSGNPRGRPPKRASKLELVPARHPTRDALRAEAERLIVINDASGKHELSVREAVLRALGLNAMRGGVLAQRTVLELFSAEDERLHRERKKSFDFWWDYQEHGRAAIAAAHQSGKAKPELLPHPEDIELDWRTLEVRFLGALDEKERAAEEVMEVVQGLAYEMAIYTQEDTCLPSAPGEEGRIGVYMLLHTFSRALLPPRLRQPLDAYDEHIRSMFRRGRDIWGEDLKRRCREVGIPFIHWRRRPQVPTLPMSELSRRRLTSG
jgi:hypothetical protein